MNGGAHRGAAGCAVFMAMAVDEERSGHSSAWPVAGGFLGALMTGMPDTLEPALHPNHRQFFHSVAFAIGLGICWKQLKDWRPDDEIARIARKVGLIAISAYLIHLALDATTPKSLPFLGN